MTVRPRTVLASAPCAAHAGNEFEAYYRISQSRQTVVADMLAEVLTGGDTDYADTLGGDDISALERKAFIALTRNQGTIERIETMLETGRSPRN
jgi:3-hydroxyacyl-CoA dehydrogenase